VRAKARLMMTRINRDLVYAGLQAAMGRIYHSVGLDSLPRTTASHETAAIGSELATHIADFEKSNFKTPVVPEMQSVAIALPQGIPGGGTDAFLSSVQRVLTAARIPLSNERAAARVETTVRLGESKDNSQSVVVKVRVSDMAGKTLAEAEHKSVLSEPVDNLQWGALGEGAGYRVVEPLRRHLGQPMIVR